MTDNHTVVVEGEKSFFFGGRCELFDTPPSGNREIAWAEKYVVTNPALKWVVGKFVEADRANHNKQFWALDQLRLAQPSISHSPLNLLHNMDHVVGAFVGTEMMYPMGAPADGAAEENPYIEALGVFWKWYFPKEYALVEASHAMGSLFFSMECVAQSITCAGESGCNVEFDYAGPRSSTYCFHLNQGESIKQLNNPHFLGGALIIPPEKPGWAGATVTDLSALVAEHKIEAELAFEGFKAASPHLNESHWEYLMATFLSQAAAKHKKGDHVRLNKPVAHAPSGTHGVVHSVNNGLFYGMMPTSPNGAGQGPVMYAPASCVDAAGPNVTPPTAVPGQQNNNAASVQVRAYLDSLLDRARKFGAEQRKKAAGDGSALPDGSFPIKTVADLKNAIKLAGKAKDPGAAKSHIKKRAKVLGAENLIPEGW